MIKNIVIIGSGPAGLTAAIYAGRAELKPFLIEGFLAGGQAGGQLMTTSEVENFPGFPKGIMGPELIAMIREQAIRFGAEMLAEDVQSIDLTHGPFRIKTGSQEIEANAVIIATGASAKLLDLPTAKKFWGRGISACATCDGALPIFRNQVVAVVGGGDTAMEETSFLSRFASKVILIHRRAEFRASRIMIERVSKNPKVELILDSVIEEAYGDKALNGLKVRNLKTSQVRDVPCKGFFMAIGHAPNTNFLGKQIPLDEKGYIIVKHPTTQTSIVGVFACGDVTDPHYRQAISAAGSGCAAAIDAERWLSERVHS